MRCASLLETVTEESATSVLLAIHHQEKNHEIHLFGLLRQEQTRRHDRGRERRDVRRLLYLRRSSSRRRPLGRWRSPPARRNRPDRLLEKRQSRHDGLSLRRNQGTAWRHRHPRSARHESRPSDRVSASLPQVWRHFRDSPGRRPKRNTKSQREPPPEICADEGCDRGGPSRKSWASIRPFGRGRPARDSTLDARIEDSVPEDRQESLQKLN